MPTHLKDSLTKAMSIVAQQGLDLGLDTRKPVFGVYEQQRHRSACASMQSVQRLFICLLDSIISRLVSVAEEAGLNIFLSETPKTGFLTSQPR